MRQALLYAGPGLAQTPDQGGGPPQAHRQAVQALALALQATRPCRLQTLVEALDGIEQYFGALGAQLGRSRRRGRAQISDKIRHSEIGLVAYAADQRHRTAGNQLRQCLVVEGP